MGGIFGEKMSWIIMLIIISVLIAVILIIYKDAIVDKITNLIDITIVRKSAP